MADTNHDVNQDDVYMTDSSHTVSEDEDDAGYLNQECSDDQGPDHHDIGGEYEGSPLHQRNLGATVEQKSSNRNVVAQKTPP